MQQQSSSCKLLMQLSQGLKRQLAIRSERKLRQKLSRSVFNSDKCRTVFICACKIGKFEAAY